LADHPITTRSRSRLRTHARRAARFLTGQNLVVDGGMTLHGSGVDGILDIVREMFGSSS
jgi:hypothetical protein